MARPMTQEHKTATEQAKALAETRERKQHMAKADETLPTDQPPVERSLTPPAE